MPSDWSSVEVLGWKSLISWPWKIHSCVPFYKELFELKSLIGPANQTLLKLLPRPVVPLKVMPQPCCQQTPGLPGFRCLSNIFADAIKESHRIIFLHFRYWFGFLMMIRITIAPLPARQWSLMNHLCGVLTWFSVGVIESLELRPLMLLHYPVWLPPLPMIHLCHMWSWHKAYSPTRLPFLSLSVELVLFKCLHDSLPMYFMAASWVEK